MQLTQVMTSIPETVSATTSSIPMDCAQMNKLSFQTTQTAAGVSFAATIQASNDAVNWVDTGASTPISGPGSVFTNLIDAASRYYRLRLVATTGTLTGVSAVFNGKF